MSLSLPSGPGCSRCMSPGGGGEHCFPLLCWAKDCCSAQRGVVQGSSPQGRWSRGLGPPPEVASLPCSPQKEISSNAASLPERKELCRAHTCVHCELPRPPPPSRGGCRPLQTIVLWSGPHLSHCRMHFLLPNLQKTNSPLGNPLMISQEGRSVQIPWGHGTVSQPAAPVESFHSAVSPTRPAPGGLGVSGFQESRWFHWGRKQVPDPGCWAHASRPGHGRPLTWAQHGAGQGEVRGELGCLSEGLLLVSLCVGFAQPAC